MTRRTKTDDAAITSALTEEAPEVPAAEASAAVPAQETQALPADQSTANAAPADEVEAQAQDHWEITGPRQGRWRDGRFFTAEPTRVPVDGLTDEEVEALLHDPAIRIRLV